VPGKTAAELFELLSQAVILLLQLGIHRDQLADDLLEQVGVIRQCRCCAGCVRVHTQ
jgi:hypothetical protein